MIFPASTSEDLLLVAIKERLFTAKAVAMAKHNSGGAVEDRGRERTVILNAVRLAVKLHLDPEVALKVFTAQIEANKAGQRTFLAKWKGKPAFSNAPDLAKDVRPKLDALTPKILQGLLRKRYRTASELTATGIDPVFRPAWNIAVQPLRLNLNRVKSGHKAVP
ncbi:MAG: gamma subclass chorismate mutase AroQ [Fimbriimonas sp.]